MPSPSCETEQGVADFHSLRVTFNTLLARAGASLAQRQAPMRHSDLKLTAGVYTRLEVSDLVAAVGYGTGRTSAHPGASAASGGAKAGTA